MAPSRIDSEPPIAKRLTEDKTTKHRPGVVSLATKLTMGRAADCDLQLSDPTVSRYHAVIESNNRGGYSLRDTGSRVGTFVNARLRETHELIFGDRIQIGPFLFRFDGRRLEPLPDGEGDTIEAIHLTRRFGKRTTLFDVSMALPGGQFVGIVGTSGAGKSTLLDALSGMCKPSEGKVMIGGANLYRHRRGTAPCGYVPQDDIVHRDLTVRAALRFSALLRLPGDVAPFEVEKLVDFTIQSLGLSERADLRVDRLSGGQRKRVSIGAELLSRPRVLFLDEPSSGLDPSTETKLMELLRELANSGCTTVCTTHVMENVYLMDQIAVVFGGRLVFLGPPNEALSHFEIARFTALYDRLEEGTAADWEKKFQGRSAANLTRPTPAKDVAPRKFRPARPRFFKILWNRHVALLRADTRSLSMLIGQPIVIGLLVAWMADNSGLKLFLAYLATLWFGCSNAAQEIVKEIAIYRRERLIGMPRWTYLLAKLVFLGTATSLQAIALFALIHLGSHPLEGSLIWQLVCLLATAWTAVGIGLAISTLVRSTTQAVMFVPLILLPQIIFSGYVIPSLATGTGIKKAITDVMPSYAAQRIMDVSLLWKKEITPTMVAQDSSYLRVDPHRTLAVGKTYRETNVVRQSLTQLLGWTAIITVVAGIGLKLRERSR
jgi:ABC-type multidrug transport system ATPase subunit